MKYILDKLNHCTFKKVEAGRLAPRAYAIPHKKSADAKRADYKNERFNSDVVSALSGEWEFKYYKKKSKLPATLDTSKIKFDKITVPSTWQRTGYEEPVYINCPYSFDPRALGGEKGQGVKPPEIPDDFSCGIYRKWLTIDKKAENYVLCFLGIASCVDLYINGIFVGYGEGSHNSYEFDVSDFLVNGENDISVKLYTYSDATYLEDQDCFRYNGIFICI